MKNLKLQKLGPRLMAAGRPVLIPLKTGGNRWRLLQMLYSPYGGLMPIGPYGEEDWMPAKLVGKFATRN